jgi:flagellar biosynthesis GTPase FlhF
MSLRTNFLIAIIRNATIWCAALLFVSVRAAELTDQEVGAAKKRQAEVIATLESTIADLEQRKTRAVKDDDRSSVKTLLAEIKAAKLSLLKAKRRTIEEFSAELASEREKARAEEEENRKKAEVAKQEELKAAEAERVEQAAAARRAEVERAVKLQEQKEEAQRLEQSGGCPLKLLKVNFYHADVDSIRRGARLARMPDTTPKHLSGQVTFVSVDLENCLDEPVAAHDLLVQFINGFDEVIEEHVLQGLLLAPKESRKTSNGWPRIDTAVEVRVSVDRAKLSDGKIWERKAEHKNVSLSIKKPAGAELGQ